MTASIRYYSVARDEFEGGNCPECARCGSTMRHVTEINGRTYGSGCGKIIIAEMERAVNQVKTANKRPTLNELMASGKLKMPAGWGSPRS
jgi:hypothetical protein